MSLPPACSSPSLSPLKIIGEPTASGGVVVGSPLTGIRIYEAALSPPLPPDYINASITDLGSTGAFQQLEKGEIGYHEFIKRFGEELGQVERGNKAYRRLCQKRGTECPKLPEKVVIDGAKLWQEMMSQATYPSEPILTAINHLRRSFFYTCRVSVDLSS